MEVEQDYKAKNGIIYQKRSMFCVFPFTKNQREKDNHTN